MLKVKSATRPKKVIQKAFLEQLELTGNVTMSAKKAKVSRRSIYGWLDADPEFKKQFDVSAKIGVELLEDEAQRRAFHGTKKPVYQGGKQVGVIQEYSDTLLIFLLKGKKPELYKDRHEVTGKDGKDLPATTFNVNIIKSGPTPVGSEKDIDLTE